MEADRLPARLSSGAPVAVAVNTGAPSPADGALDPVESQREVLMRLIGRAQATRFGRAHDFAHIHDVAGFQERCRDLE